MKSSLLKSSPRADIITKLVLKPHYEGSIAPKYNGSSASAGFGRVTAMNCKFLSTYPKNNSSFSPLNHFFHSNATCQTSYLRHLPKIGSNFSSTSSRMSSTAMVSVKPGMLHIGNIFGCLDTCVRLQAEGHQLHLCISDIENLQVFTRRKDMNDSILLSIASFLACGIDPGESNIFQQSQMSYHAQLDWLLHCLVNEKEPERMASHMSKISTKKDITLGQYVSPILHSADVLLYKTNLIPIGSDMTDQIQLVQHIAQLLNKSYGNCVPVPNIVVREGFASRIRSIRQPAERMTRSSNDKKSRIDIMDSSDMIVSKCKKAVTDFTSEVYFDEINRPGVSNLVAIHSLITGKSYDIIQEESKGQQTAQYKLVVADSLIKYLTPLQEKIRLYLADKGYLKTVVESGASRAKLVAEETLRELYDKVGFLDKKNYNRSISPLSNTSTPASLNLSTNPSSHPNCKKIFSGIQPTGVLHLGNYFGAVKQWVDLQDGINDVTLCVVDQHAVTVPQNRDQLLDNTLTMAASLIACGVDPENSILFQQSRVSQHSELNVLLRSVVHTALLSRQAHYKDKISKLEESPSLGLFSYPVLQAADILLYGATHVPVGDDQKQHLQVACQIARQFNAKFGKNIFRLPETMILDSSLARLKSLCLPSKKMSKSENDRQSRIEILDSPSEINSKIKNANVFGYIGLLSDVPCESKPAIDNLMAMHSIVGGISVEDLTKEYSNVSIRDYKAVVAEVVVEHLKPMKKRADELLSEPAYLQQVMEAGADRARARAHQTLTHLHNKIGFKL